MATSDLIASFILDQLETCGFAEIQRSGLAEKFCCVPSQINYVLTTRFAPEHGYIVESRRGGGGYIRIKRVSPTPDRLVLHLVNSMGDIVDFQMSRALISNALHAGALDENSANLILTAVSDSALKAVSQPMRNMVRASIIKHMLIATAELKG